MTRMWRGDCEELKRASADSLWAAIHRRGGRHFVACKVDHNGRAADFYRIEKIRGEWYQFDLGRVTGADPFSTVLAGFRQFTPFDAELFRQNHAYVERLAEDIVLDGNAVVKKISQAVDQFLP